VVYDVENLGAELEALLLGNGEILANAQIPLPEAGIPEDVARLLAERAGCRLRERRFVELRGIVDE
jgi:hypothetical protein